jgi:hypothetical protein
MKSTAGGQTVDSRIIEYGKTGAQHVQRFL